MKHILVICSLLVTQSVFAKSIAEEVKERIAIVNQASAERAFAVNDRFTDVAAAIANKLTSAGVISVEVVSSGQLVYEQSEASIYQNVSQTSIFAVRLMTGDLCQIVLKNSAEPFSEQRAVQLRGEIYPQNVTCVGLQGETVVETKNDYSKDIVSSVNGEELRSDRPVAEYTFISFNVLL